MTYSQVASLSHEALIDEVRRLTTLENQCVVKQIVYIMEIDQRKLHVMKGYGNLASFLHARCGLTPDQAAKRIQVARVCWHLPIVLEALRSGR